MPIPLVVPLALMAGSAIAGAGANWYSQAKQRDLYRYQRNAYQRYYDDYIQNRLPKGRTVKYPELSIPGKIRALDTGISESYASSVGTGARLASTISAGGFAYGRASGSTLYGQSGGRSSRYL